jgi:ubiquinone/menaquinone biosynthesis C-methylase UbiE
MPTEQEVYAQHANLYDQLIQREDAAGNLLAAFLGIVDVRGLDVIDLGAGTGRLTRLLAPYARTVRAFDASGAMLKVARQSIRTAGWSHCEVQVADHRQIPVQAASADLVVSGWSFSYLSTWGDRSQLERGWGEVVRILRPGGMALFVESLGTGQENPIRLDHLKDYYAWLDENGFEQMQISTDYLFKSEEEARELVGFFFGEQMASEIGKKYTTTLPEWTGLWWRTVSK